MRNECYKVRNIKPFLYSRYTTLSIFLSCSPFERITFFCTYKRWKANWYRNVEQRQRNNEGRGTTRYNYAKLEDLVTTSSIYEISYYRLSFSLSRVLLLRMNLIAMAVVSLKILVPVRLKNFWRNAPIRYYFLSLFGLMISTNKKTSVEKKKLEEHKIERRNRKCC